MFCSVIDIGTPGKSLGWAALSTAGDMVDGTDVDTCIGLLSKALRVGPVALGFEAPMWIPTRLDPTRLTSARHGEAGPGLASRPFSASAGATVLVTGMVVVTYVMRRLRELAPDATVHYDWRNFPNEPGQLLVWEAFVTNQKKTHDTRHVEDAKLALAAFLSGMESPQAFRSSVEEPDCLNLLGAALLKAGWTSDVALLSAPCLVVRTN
jgi:hypothetical protein